MKILTNSIKHDAVVVREGDKDINYIHVTYQYLDDKNRNIQEEAYIKATDLVDDGGDITDQVVINYLAGLG